MKPDIVQSPTVGGQGPGLVSPFQVYNECTVPSCWGRKDPGLMEVDSWSRRDQRVPNRTLQTFFSVVAMVRSSTTKSQCETEGKEMASNIREAVQCPTGTHSPLVSMITRERHTNTISFSSYIWMASNLLATVVFTELFAQSYCVSLPVCGICTCPYMCTGMSVCICVEVSVGVGCHPPLLSALFS